MPEERDPDLETTRETPVGDDPEIVAGRYRILRTLGRGGGGIVWLALDEHLGREVALKRVAGETDAEVLVTRGLREARTSAALAHDKVVRVYDAFVHDHFPWIVMEYVPGPALSTVLDRGQALPVAQVARIGAQVATALAAAHGAGVVHRDVKPGNVLLTDESGGDAKLTDFGIARAEDDHQLTRTGMVSGTAAYFSPELARGEDPSAASDVWALGATLYAAVEGRRPYPDAGNPVAQLHMIARDTPRAPRLAGPLEPVLRGMLDPDPSRRWTAERAAQALTELAEGRPGAGGGAAAAGAAAGTAAGAAAGSAAGAAAGAAWAADEGRSDADRTQMVGPETTRQVPVQPARSGGGGPSAGGGPGVADHGYAARPQSAPDARHAGPAAPVAGPRRTAPPAGRRSGGRGTSVLVWLVAIPLVALLAWLVWTIASGGLPGQDDASPSPTTTATQDQPVSTEEAEGTVRAFYTALQDEGLAAARQYMVEGVPVDEAIAEGLESVEVTVDGSRELGQGVVETVATATYAYGPCTIVQQETMQVARRGTEALIVQRVTQTTSTTGCRSESLETGAGEDGGGEDGGDEAPADADPADEGTDDQGDDDASTGG